MIASDKHMALEAGAHFTCMHARWAVHKLMIRPPLLDPEVPDDKLAAWIDQHTMHVHQFSGAAEGAPLQSEGGDAGCSQPGC